MAQTTTDDDGVRPPGPENKPAATKNTAQALQNNLVGHLVPKSEQAGTKSTSQACKPFVPHEHHDRIFGLRLLHDDQRAFFRLAVQKVEVAYGIQVAHPLFFYWMQDPLSELGAYRDDEYFFLGMFIFFALQPFLVVVASMLFSKLGE